MHYKTLLKMLGNLADFEALLRLEIDTMEIGEAVALGHALWRLSVAAQKVLGSITERLRAQAQQDREDPGPVRYTGSEADTGCLVVVQRPRVRLRKGVDMNGLQQALGDDFYTYFTATVRFGAVSGFLDTASDAGPETSTRLQEVVDIVHDKPRVTFKGQGKRVK